MPKITTLQYLSQIDHCLDGLRTDDVLRNEEIDELKEEVHSFVELCLLGQEAIAKAGIDLIAPRVDALARFPNSAGLAENTRDTLPAPAPDSTI